MNFLSLFAGIGGMDLGLERAGMRCVGQVEINPFCRQVLAKHWPHVTRWHDVTKFCRRCYDCEPETEDGEVFCNRCQMDFGDCDCVGTDAYTDEYGTPDLICGGDPCQAHSNARTHGATPASLGGEFVRIVEQLRSKWVLRENPAAVRKDAEWTAERFAGALVELGYRCVIFPAKACCVGADHPRRRLFVLAELQDTYGEGLERHECEILAGAFRGRQNADAARSDRWYATPRICRGVDGIPHRVDRLRSLGNAVAPKVAEVIGRMIVESQVDYKKENKHFSEQR